MLIIPSFLKITEIPLNDYYLNALNLTFNRILIVCIMISIIIILYKIFCAIWRYMYSCPCV